MQTIEMAVRAVQGSPKKQPSGDEAGRSCDRACGLKKRAFQEPFVDQGGADMMSFLISGETPVKLKLLIKQL